MITTARFTCEVRFPSGVWAYAEAPLTSSSKLKTMAFSNDRTGRTLLLKRPLSAAILVEIGSVEMYRNSYSPQFSDSGRSLTFGLWPSVFGLPESLSRLAEVKGQRPKSKREKTLIVSHKNTLDCLNKNKFCQQLAAFARIILACSLQSKAATSLNEHVQGG